MKAERRKVNWGRGLRWAMWALVPAGLALLVTAGTVQTTALPPPADDLQRMLDRVDGATVVIARCMEASRIPPDWEAAGANRESVLPDVAAETAEPEAVVVLDESESLRERMAQLTLNGIAWNPDNPVAFVSQRTLALDGEIEGLRVVFIGPDNVVFEDERGRTRELRLGTYTEHLQARAN